MKLPYFHPSHLLTKKKLFDYFIFFNLRIIFPRQPRNGPQQLRYVRRTISGLELPFCESLRDWLVACTIFPDQCALSERPIFRVF